MTEGPLDLTVPLNIAEIRAALATTGPRRKVGLAAYVATSRSASVDPARPQDGHRRQHAASKRLGRMVAFVAAAVALSVGTACALVLSDNAQNTSVSLPATGTIPVALSPTDTQPGRTTGDSGSTSAETTPGLLHSTAPHLPVAGSTTKSATGAPSPSATATGTASGDPSATATADSSASATDPAGTPPSFGPAPTGNSGGTDWEVLHQGENEDSQAQQETTDVQSLLLNLGYLAPWRHRSYIDPDYTYSADATGYYGSATADAIAQFQQDYGVDYSDQLGACDATTYQDLLAVAEASSD